MNKQAFTLIELLVWITISMILMVSVSLFVSSGIQNILTQEKVLNNNPEFIGGMKQLHNSLKNIRTTNSFSWTFWSSGALFLTNKEYDRGWLTFIWEKSLSGIYCETDSEYSDTKHLIIKKFIPFEWIDADIMSTSNTYNYNNITTLIKTNYFSGTIQKSSIDFNWEYYWPTDAYTNGTILYVSDTLNNTILEFDYSSPLQTGSIIIGKQIPGDNFSESMLATGALLNNPTGLTMADGKLLIADTLNNRILYLSGTTIHKLLDENDWLSEPTGLFYDDTDKALYISNSGKGEVLKYASNSTPKNLNFSFQVDKNINNLQKLELEFLPDTTNISYPSDTVHFNFNSTLNKYSDYFTWSTNTISYYFSNFWSHFDTQSWIPCWGNWSTYSIDWSWDVIRDTISWCSGTGTLRKYRTNTYQDISSWSTIKITTPFEITGWWISNNGNYYTKITLSWNSWDRFETLEYHYTNSDNSIFTKDDNTLETIIAWIWYPTGIEKLGNEIRVNDSLNRERITYNILTESIIKDSSVLQDFTYEKLQNLPYNKYSDTLIKTPIKSFEIQKSWDLISSKLKYYKSFHCYNSDMNSASWSTNTFYNKTNVK